MSYWLPFIHSAKESVSFLALSESDSVVVVEELARFFRGVTNGTEEAVEDGNIAVE